MTMLLVLIAAAFEPSSAQNARAIAQASAPSVLLLVMEDANGQPLSLGSGFVVREDIVATNLHVIGRASSGYAKLVGQKGKYEVSGIVGLDRVHDLVLLAVRGCAAPSIPLGDSSAVAVGDEVFVVGNPYGLEGTFSQGIVSGVRNVGPRSLFQITAPISPGSSGGPVMNSRGEVVGVAVATFRAGQNLNFAIPAFYLEKLLGDVGPVRPLSTVRQSSRSASTVDDVGGASVRGVVGTQFAWGIELVQGPVILLKEIDFTFSLRNQLPVPVKNVRFIVIFYDRLGKPLEVYEGDYVRSEGFGVIRPGLAKRAGGSVDITVRRLTARAEIRVLSFEIVE